MMRSEAEIRAEIERLRRDRVVTKNGLDVAEFVSVLEWVLSAPSAPASPTGEGLAQDICRQFSVGPDEYYDKVTWVEGRIRAALGQARAKALEELAQHLARFGSRFADAHEEIVSLKDDRP